MEQANQQINHQVLSSLLFRTEIKHAMVFLLSPSKGLKLTLDLRQREWFFATELIG